MKGSIFDNLLISEVGIVKLMEDLGEALNVNPNILFLGGGNPARIERFEQIVSDQLGAIVSNPDKLHKIIGVYQSPRGDEKFIDQLAGYLNRHCGWAVTNKNIAVTNGGQSTLFILINMLTNGSDQKLCFPIMPEYLGYSSQGLIDNFAVGLKPNIKEIGQHFFKYQIDFQALAETNNIGAYCISVPTNPSGNVLALEDIDRLTQIATSKGARVIVDCAYGNPFPGIVYDQSELAWDARRIYVFSLSKLGMPGLRCGIIVAEEETIDHFVTINTVINLANSNLGPIITSSLLQHNLLPQICRDILLPFYRDQRDFTIAHIEKSLDGIPYRIHNPEGAFFLWLWLPELPITSMELYKRLKSKDVLVMPGEYFFFGIEQPWPHSRQCLRLTYCQSKKDIEKAIAILGQELKELYQ